MTKTAVKPILMMKIVAWAVVAFIFFGNLFKFLHWPGASMLLPLGTFFFLCLYVPLYVADMWKSRETWKTKLLLIGHALVVIVIATGVLFLNQHWPGASVFYYLVQLLIAFIVFPFLFISIRNGLKNDLVKAHAFVLIFYFGFQLHRMLTQSREGYVKGETVVQQATETERTLRISTARNARLYDNLQSLETDSAGAILAQADKLKSLTDSTIAYIQRFRRYVVSQTDMADDPVFANKLDSLGSMGYDFKRLNMTAYITLSDEGEMTPAKLKQVIRAYSDSVLLLADEANRPVIKAGINLNTDNQMHEEMGLLTWEEVHFDHTPIIYMYDVLSRLACEIRNAEHQVLTDIVNSGSKGLNTALVSQISELNAKYEAQQKQLEIEKLRGENEMGLKMLHEKEEQVNEVSGMVAWLFAAIFLFVILVVFIVRSNQLRKQANAVLAMQKRTIEDQKHQVEEKQKEILDSITYAKRLQDAILPPQAFIDAALPENFVLYRPKDIVAGDFYWAERVGELFFIAAADSTGHGVPGAMVSVVCSNALNRAVKEFGLTDTGKILDKARALVVETFEKSQSEVKDGMDISLLRVDTANGKAQWSGAHNPLWYVQRGAMKEIKADKQPIGVSDNPQPFTTHEIAEAKGATFYLFTDGFADQFGGANGKKFKYKPFSEVLLSLGDMPMHQQSIAIIKKFDQWKGDLEQVDDVCVIGVRC